MVALYAVPTIEIPLTLDHRRLVAHARRLAELTRAYTAALPRIPPREQPAFADLPPLGVGLSWAADLGVIELRTPVVRKMVWPGSPSAERMKAAVAADVPRYEPSWRSWGDCPVPGSRGGKCHERGRTNTRWVTDLATGVWEWRQMCDMHLPIALSRQEEAPPAAPNRGGVLAEVFPDLNVPNMYEWARPGKTDFTAPRTPAVAEPGRRPTLRLFATTPAPQPATVPAGGPAWGSATDHARTYAPLLPKHRRRSCYCGCGGNATHSGLANGVALRSGCEWSIRRWVQDQDSGGHGDHR